MYRLLIFTMGLFLACEDDKSEQKKEYSVVETALIMPAMNSFERVTLGVFNLHYKLEADEEGKWNLTHHSNDDNSHFVGSYSCKKTFEETESLPLTTIIDELESAEICVATREAAISHCGSRVVEFTFKENIQKAESAFPNTQYGVLNVAENADSKCAFEYSYFCDGNFLNKLMDRMKEAYPPLKM